ncbi:MAG: hypothetical protein UH853_01985 [Muribaculaceae bacterium]|nr:hypothetical protein [Muribaculaceae bacterium]
MPRIHLFNPENDLALAFGGSNYTPPANALALHNAGAALPLFYGERGDMVIGGEIDKSWVAEMVDRFDLGVSLFDGYYPLECEASPWGWSLDARRQLEQAGVNQNALISPEQIECLRQLSHRRLTVEVMAQLAQSLPFEIPARPIEATTPKQVLDYHKEHGGCYVKLPWSSSGRGVFDASGLTDDALLSRVKGMINRQGSVMCEQRLDKVEDFAMLFYSDGRQVKRVGYSAFYNEHGASYGGNIVANDDILGRRLGRIVGEDRLRLISEALQSILTLIIAPHYKGYFGVDMLAYTDGSQVLVAPCVEINLRMTMGVVAWRLAQTVLADGLSARFSVSYGGSVQPARMAAIENNRLIAGTVSLIPPHKNFNITLEVIED